ncbi:MAG: cupin domain-containing protein [Mycobacteriaceae bacterium]|jgi:predicted cupin superfamily sugar epimerase
MTEIPEWVRRLDLAPHPEGGLFRETWRSDLTLEPPTLPSHYDGPRAAGTAILFALLPGQESAWHTVRSAELWLHHRGSPVALEFGPGRDSAKTVLLGSDIEAGQHPQLLVPAGHWQRARTHGAEPSLVSCVVVPGFDFADFDLEP